MNPIDKTVKAKFKGVPFFVRVETHEGGRKVAVHEYPGSDVRFVQDLGKRPGIYRIIGYVGGENWIQDSARLTTVLEEETEGILELSTFGRFKVKAQFFSSVVKQRELGIVEYTITFLVSRPNPSPAKALSSVQTTAGAALRAMLAVEDSVAGNLEVPDLASTTLVSEYDGVQHTTSVLDRIKKLGQNVDSLTGFADNIRDNISDLVRDPVAYASDMFTGGLLGNVFDIVEASRDTLNALSELCRVGYNLAVDFESIENDLLSNAIQSFDIPEFADNTSYRNLNNSNRLVITNGVRIALFGIYLKLAAGNEYLTDSEIEEVISDINDIYENIVLVAITDPVAALSIDLCRIEALNVLDTKIQITPKVEDFRLRAATVDVELAYRLYAETVDGVDSLTERAGVLTDLNNTLPNRFLSETDIKVLNL